MGLLLLGFPGANLLNVEVRVERKLNAPPSSIAREWRDFCWRGGGGLPLVTLNDESSEARRLLPVGLAERIVSSTDDSVVYEVYDVGLMRDVIPGSHRGEVTFEADGEDTLVSWHVRFQAAKNEAFLEAMTTTTISEVLANLDARTKPPEVFTISSDLGAAPAVAAETWVAMLRANDLGSAVPLPPPIVLAAGDPDGTDYRRMLFPPGLIERVLTVDKSPKEASVTYRLENPSWLTFYPAHSHLGRIRWVGGTGEGTSTMHWTIEVQPMRFGAWLVRLVTNAIVPPFVTRLQELCQGQQQASDDLASPSKQPPPCFKWTKYSSSSDSELGK